MILLLATLVVAAAVWQLSSLDPDERAQLWARVRRATDMSGRAVSRSRRVKVDLSAPAEWTAPTQLPTRTLGDGPQIALGITGAPAKRKLVYAPPDKPVLVTGASGSGKTTAVIAPAILDWEGPVVTTSVKHDVLSITGGYRQRLGPVAVFDPSNSLPHELAHLSRPWTPLGACRTWPSAMKTAAALIAASSGQSANGEHAFWDDQAQLLLAPILFHETAIDGTMREVNRWLAGLTAPDESYEHDGTRAGQTVADLLAALEELAAHGIPDAAIAAETLRPIEGYAPQTASSIVASANRALRAYKMGSSGEEVRPSDPRLISSDMILDHSGSLYLVGPPAEQRVYRPIFTALLAHVIDESYRRASGRLDGRVERPLLVAADELANIAPVPELDTIASTARSFGITLLTAVQDLSQLRNAYGEHAASSLVSNQSTVLVLPGTKDLATLQWASTIAGEHLVTERSTSESRSHSTNRGEFTASSGSKSSNLNVSRTLRPLASQARIAAMDPHLMLAIVEHHRAVLSQRRHYQDPRLLQRSHLPLAGGSRSVCSRANSVGVDRFTSHPAD